MSRPSNSSFAPALTIISRRFATSSTTLLSSTSRIHDALHDRICIGEGLEYSVCAMRSKLLDGISSRCNSDRSRTDRLTAPDVGRRVANHNESVPRDFRPDYIARTCLGDCREFWPFLVI